MILPPPWTFARRCAVFDAVALTVIAVMWKMPERVWEWRRVAQRAA